MEIHSFKVTLMVRFLPLPFGLQNGLCAVYIIKEREKECNNIILYRWQVSHRQCFWLLQLLDSYLRISSWSTLGEVSKLSKAKILAPFPYPPTTSSLVISTLTIAYAYEKFMIGGAIIVTLIIFILGRKMLNATLSQARSSNKKAEDSLPFLPLTILRDNTKEV